MSQDKRDAAKLLFAALESQASQNDDDDDFEIIPTAPASRAPRSRSAAMDISSPGTPKGGASASQAIDLSESPPRPAVGARIQPASAKRAGPAQSRSKWAYKMTRDSLPVLKFATIDEESSTLDLSSCGITNTDAADIANIVAVHTSLLCFVD